MASRPLIVGISGASGIVYGVRLLEWLRPTGVETHLVVSRAADLTRAHEAVLVAKDQIQRLAPLVDHLDRRRTLLTGLEELRVCREALHPYMMGLKEELLDRRLEELNREAEQIRGKIRVLEERCGTLRARRDELIAHIAADGGDRLEALRRQIRELEAERERRR